MGKKAANIPVHEDLLAEASAAGIDLSQILEEALREKLKLSRRDAWLEENREGLEAYRQYVEANGTLGTRLRSIRRF